MGDKKRGHSQPDCQEREAESNKQRRRGLLPVLGAPLIPNLPGYADAGNRWPLPVVSGCQSASRSEELTLRVLCPSSKIGRVIGKGGSIINSVRQASGARIKVDDFKADGDQRVITVTSAESPDDLKSKSMEAVLLLQEKINDEGDETVTIRLLVPAKVIGVIIGRAGSVVNDIRTRTKAKVNISKEIKPNCASDSDALVEVVGSVESVRDALFLIVQRLRDDVLKEKESVHNSVAVPVSYSGNSSFAVPSILPCIPPVSQSSNFFNHGSLLTSDNGNVSSSQSSNPYGGLPPPLTIEMLIPGHAVGKVLGKGGANLANIRKISGAVVEISEKSSCGNCIAFISGTSEQMRAAEDLVQAFIMAT